MKLIIALMLFVVSVVHATTWTCTKDAESIVTGAYQVVGTCTASGNYTTNGDAIGASTSLPDTAAVLCGSSARIPKNVILTASGDGTPAGLTVDTFDLTNRKVMCYTAVNAVGATVPLAQCGALVPSAFRFQAICQ